jgi:hypothetical protein
MSWKLVWCSHILWVWPRRCHSDRPVIDNICSVSESTLTTLENGNLGIHSKQRWKYRFNNSNVAKEQCWGIQNQAFRIPKIKECFQLPEFLCERPSGETPGVLESIFISQNPSFDQYPSSPAEPPNKLRITQGVRVSVRLFGFPRDGTPDTNLAHPVSLGLGFAWGISSSLTYND